MSAESSVDLDRDPTSIVTTRVIAAPRDLVFEPNGAHRGAMETLARLDDYVRTMRR